MPLENVRWWSMWILFLVDRPYKQDTRKGSKKDKRVERERQVKSGMIVKMS